MTDEELKQFKELAAKYERGKDKDAVIKIIQDSAHEVYQDVHDRGHSAATATKQRTIDEISGQLTTTKSLAEELQRKLDAMKEAPDIATMREKYEKDEKTLRDQHAAALENQKKELEAKVTEREQALVNTRLTVAKSKLVDVLTNDKNAIDKDYAETVLIARPDVAERLVVEPDGSFKVKKAGSPDMFIVPGEGRTALDHLAEELAEKVDAKWKVSGGGRGSGTRGSEGGAGAGTAERFEATRKRVEQREKEGAAAKAGGSGLERLGARR